MERTLDPAVLNLALGVHGQLPSPDELAALLANAEVSLLVRREADIQSLLSAAWYLHGIASTREALALYTVERRRAAYSVSAHIFDVTLQHSPSATPLHRLEWAFAAQVAFLNSELDPNALAIFSRDAQPILQRPPDLIEHDMLGLSLAVALVGADANYLFPALDRLRAIESELFSDPVSEFRSSHLVAVLSVVRAVRHLLVFLVYGDETRLVEARETLIAGIASPVAEYDHTCRWVIAHLLNLIDHFGTSSIWTALPPEVPPGIRRAFAMAVPRVVTLWPPQLTTFSPIETSNPLSSSVRRALLSMPTSAGKSLMAQLIVASHLGQGLGGVCYIAPTRSLCNEVRGALDRRLGNIDFSVVSDLPDWVDLDWASIDANVEVMTPERLGFLVRNDIAAVLQRFTLFIFDEVHTVSDEARGWGLEATLTYLHDATANTEHRMVLMSAALGNQAQFISWLASIGADPVARSSDWRGPRRLHCLWETVRDDSRAKDSSVSSSQYPTRRRVPLHGRLHARVTRSGVPAVLTTQDPIGELVLKVPKSGRPVRDSSLSTPVYRMLAPLVELLAEVGPVLIIEGTRSSTVRMAKALAEAETASAEGINDLIDLVQSRLGPSHPLTAVLHEGVAYHHGSLPLDVREAIEEAVRDGRIRIIVATTSLTEGVNLPVRSVVIATQGAYGPEGYQEFISKSRLVNAIGRAGRAARETEGIVVLNRMQRVSLTDFDRLDPPAQDLEAMSLLASQELLEALDVFEEAQRQRVDAVFEAKSGPLSDFLGFVWFLAAELERTEEDVNETDIARILSRTLGWQQVDDNRRERLLSAARETLRSYRSRDPQRRSAMGRAGMSLPSASRLLDIADEVARIEISDDIQPLDLVDSLLAQGRFQKLLGLTEAPKVKVYDRRAGRGRGEVFVNIDSLMRDWLSGVELADLSATYLSSVSDDEYRAEQLGDLISGLFESYLPWVLASVIGWANEIRRESGLSLIPHELPAFIRWGVDRTECLQVLYRGIRTRRLAHSVVAAWANAGVDEDVLSWFRGLEIADWVPLFDPSPSELANLLDFARVRRGSVVAAVLAGGVGTLRFDASTTGQIPRSPGRFHLVAGARPPRIEIQVDNGIAGVVPGGHVVDVTSLMAMGMRFGVAVAVDAGEGLVSIELEREPFE